MLVGAIHMRTPSSLLFRPHAPPLVAFGRSLLDRGLKVSNIVKNIGITFRLGMPQ